MLTLIGRPRSEWAPRRAPGRPDDDAGGRASSASASSRRRAGTSERLRASFEHDASGASLDPRQPARGAAARARGAARRVHRRPPACRAPTCGWRRQRWLDSGAVSAMGWSERVRRDDIPAFEARVRAEGASGYRVFDRTDAVAPLEGLAPAGQPPSRADGADVIAVRLIEPLHGNAAALGVNGLSVPAARAAIQQAVDTGHAGGDRGLSPDPAGRAATSGWASSSTRRSTTARRPTVAQRRAALRGVVFVTLTHGHAARRRRRPGAGLPASCASSTPTRWRRGGACRAARAARASAPRLLHERPIVFAGRQLGGARQRRAGNGPRQRRSQRLHDRRRRPAVGGDARRLAADHRPAGRGASRAQCASARRPCAPR